MTCGIGIGFGLFLLLIAASSIGLSIKNPQQGLPLHLGAFTSFPALMTLLGLAMIFSLERRGIHGAVLWVTIFLRLDIIGALYMIILSSVLALVMTAVFDATGTIHAVTSQAKLLQRQ